MAKKIAIIGGGIIGLYIGWKLSQKGESVVIFEKKNESEADFKCCSGLVSERIKDFIPVDDSFIINEIKSCKIKFPKKQVELIFNPNHLALNREKVIRKLIKLNRDVGTTIRFGEEINNTPTGYDKIIFCDGANSFIKKQNGFKNDFRLGAQIIVEEKNDKNFAETFFINSGFCWKIPKREITEYGIITKPKILLSEFDKFLSLYGKTKESGKFYSAVIPQPKNFNSLFFSENKNIFLCGDALGLVKPWSGGGVIWNLVAADLLIKNIDNSFVYKKAIRNKFAWQIFKGAISNKLVGFLGNKVPIFLPKKIIYDNDFPNIIKSLLGLIKIRKSANL
ncbi:MAG: NAD(P)-binding protein [Candidatus Pacebacteria bacterium]|nr:NAD(P)-binding protein [Candidatus Paceibacterota bacterium]